jgi:hypothetical protein
MLFVGAIPFSAEVVGAAVDVKPPRSDGGTVITMLHGGKLLNKNAAVAYLQVFDKPAANVVLGTTAPKFYIPLGANEGMNLADVAVRFEGTGFSVAATTLPGNAVAAAISTTLFFE